MALKLETFDDIVDSIREAIGVTASDTNAINKIKRQVNLYYLNEVVPFKRWQWLEKSVKVHHSAYYGAGTVSVTPDSTTATLSVAPNVSLGSFAGYRFSLDNSAVVYTISAHTAGSATLTLETAFRESLNATAAYKVWRDRLDLPTDAKETIEIWHAEQPKPLEGVGSQGFRKLEAANPKLEGFPTHYNTWDFYDPSSGTDELESDRYRQVRLYPSITATAVTLNIDYIQEVSALEDDADEPLLPISDRIVLYYGAGAECWSILIRNEEMADRWRLKAQAKLARMAGDREDGMDTPSLSPKSNYINSIRRSGLRNRNIGVHGLTGQSAYSSPTYAKDITIEGANITDDVTVVADVTIDGRDISDDGALLDSIASTTSVTLTDNTTNGVVTTWNLTTVADTVHIQYSVKRSTARMAGKITVISDGTTAAIAESAAQTADTGVTFSVDVTGGTVRLLYTTTSTGDNATMKYQKIEWLA